MDVAIPSWKTGTYCSLMAVVKYMELTYTVGIGASKRGSACCSDMLADEVVSSSFPNPSGFPNPGLSFLASFRIFSMSRKFALWTRAAANRIWGARAVCACLQGGKTGQGARTCEGELGHVHGAPGCFK